MFAFSHHVLNYRLLPVSLFLAGLWIQLCFVLSSSWQTQTYYDYGWILPVLMAFLGYQRWQVAPASIPRSDRATLPLIFISLLTLAIVPIRLVEHVDVYWRLPLWIHAFLVFSITHLSIALIRGWNASKALLPASLFVFLAVPLPSLIEISFVRGLTEVVLEFTSFLLPFNGYPIETSGSSFIVKDEIVDVAEGCSGIRSFQSCIVAALALGEFNRSSISRRVILLLLSLGLAVIFNSLRVFTLVQIAHERGPQEVQMSHDTIGFWTMVATFTSIALVAWLLALSQNARSSTKRRSKKTTKPSSQKA